MRALLWGESLVGSGHARVQSELAQQLQRYGWQITVITGSRMHTDHFNFGQATMIYQDALHLSASDSDPYNMANLFTPAGISFSRDRVYQQTRVDRLFEVYRDTQPHAVVTEMWLRPNARSCLKSSIGKVVISTTEPRSHTNRHEDESGRCRSSNRPVTRNVSFPVIAGSTITSNFGVTFCQPRIIDPPAAMHSPHSARSLASTEQKSATPDPNPFRLCGQQPDNARVRSFREPRRVTNATSPSSRAVETSCRRGRAPLRQPRVVALRRPATHHPYLADPSTHLSHRNRPPARCPDQPWGKDLRRSGRKPTSEPRPTTDARVGVGATALSTPLVAGPASSAWRHRIRRSASPRWFANRRGDCSR